MRVGLAVAASGFCLLFAGCSGGAFSGLNQANSSGGVAGAKLTGVVHGGQQPIAGAQVYLFAAGTSGYGGAGIAASASNASVSLLTSGTGRTLDTSGGPTNGDYYVTTDAGGNFSITGDYTCAAGQQVYLYALGGNPGSGTNAAAGLMAVLGACPAAGNFASATPYVVVNEVSTVAAAYAMAGFATDATHVGSSGTALALTGIANAFANAENLVNLWTGAALATTPAGNGTAPQAEINTLGNILASCVNTNGSMTGPTNPTACYTLFTNALTGGSTGTQPGDTATAAINIAHNPAANLASLYAIGAATPPFAPALASQPADLTVGIAFTGGGLSNPHNLAIDGAGDAWVASTGSNSVVELSSLGAFLSGASGYSGGGLTFPSYIAIDTSGNAWVTGNTVVVEFSGSGGLLSGSSGYTGLNSLGNNSLTGTSGIAIDSSGNVWVPNSSGNFGVSEFNSTGSFLGWINGLSYGMSVPQGIAADASGHVWVANLANNTLSEFSTAVGSGAGIGVSPGGGMNGPSQIAIDSAGSPWVTNLGASGVTKVSKTGAALSGTNGFTGGGLADSESIAIDGAGDAWVASDGAKSMIEFSNSGVVMSGPSGYRSGTSNYAVGMAIDGSGDVWATVSDGSVLEVLGVAVPVVTPLAAGAANNSLGTRP